MSMYTDLESAKRAAVESRNVGAVFIPIIGKRLFRLAIAWSNAPLKTQQLQRDAVKAITQRKQIIFGSRSIETARQAVDAAAIAIASNSLSRRPRPSGQRLQVYTPWLTPISQRLHALRIDAVSLAWRQCDYRSGGAGGTEFSVKLLPFGFDNTPNYRTESAKNYNLYSGSHKGWAAAVDCHYISVRQNWRAIPEQIKTAGSMLTLDASLAQPGSEVDVYRAIWAEQSRGYSVRTVSGYIALHRSSGLTYHASTLSRAIKGICRKFNSDRVISLTVNPVIASLQRLVGSKKAADVFICWADILNPDCPVCDSGSRAFAERHNLDLNKHYSVATIARLAVGDYAARDALALCRWVMKQSAKQEAA